MKDVWCFFQKKHSRGQLPNSYALTDFSSKNINNPAYIFLEISRLMRILVQNLSVLVLQTLCDQLLVPQNKI